MRILTSPVQSQRYLIPKLYTQCQCFPDLTGRASPVFNGGGPIGSGMVEISPLDEAFTLEEFTYEQYLELKARFEKQFGPIEFGPTR